ncbi:MAG TPA: hypothetical protein VF800_27480 [Telluria sp.]|jgi:hypothetical protein
MSFSDEILKAYADGALGDATRQAVEAALRQDPLLAARVRQLQAQRSNAFAGFGPGSADGTAQRQPQAPRSAKVVHLHAVRAARVAAVPAPQPAADDTPQVWSWPAWAKLGGMLLAGVLAGAGLGYAVQPVPLALAEGDGAAMMARGELARALTQQLSGAPGPDAPVRIDQSFLSKEGAYCRSFRLANGGGLACRAEGGAWQLDLFAGMDGTPSEYLTPGRGMPQAVLGAIERRADEPLDALAERAARDRGWHR